MAFVVFTGILNLCISILLISLTIFFVGILIFMSIELLKSEGYIKPKKGGCVDEDKN